MKKVFTILKQSETTTDEMIYVVEQYIKKKKNKEVTINLEKNNPRIAMNMFWEERYLSEIQLLDTAFRQAAKWFWENEKELG
jgi:hypothetical protein